MKRREFLGAAAASLATLPVWSAETLRRPNFLVIVADDMGWADIGCYGRDDVKTPAIDSLARDGMKFEQGIRQTATPSRCGDASDFVWLIAVPI